MGHPTVDSDRRHQQWVSGLTEGSRLEKSRIVSKAIVRRLPLTLDEFNAIFNAVDASILFSQFNLFRVNIDGDHCKRRYSIRMGSSTPWPRYLVHRWMQIEWYCLQHHRKHRQSHRSGNVWRCVEQFSPVLHWTIPLDVASKWSSMFISS